MSVPSPSCRVINLGYKLQRDLLAQLDENAAWELVARTSGKFSEEDIFRLERSTSSSLDVLVELDIKLCTVKRLCEYLEECKLFDALTLLKENEPLVITKQPGSDDGDQEPTCYVPLGGQLRLECEATGLPPPKYEWYREDQNIELSRNANLLIDNFKERDVGKYYCTVSQPGYTVNSRLVNVQVLPQLPKFLKQPDPAMVICKEGQDVTISCEVSGYPRPKIQWLHNRNCYVNHQESNILKLNNIQISKSGRYRCYAKNEAGEVYSDTAQVQVSERCETSVTADPPKRHQAVEKVALLIANDFYENAEKLKNPKNDVRTLATHLTSLGFKVIALRNLNKTEMNNALKIFCKLLHGGDYALFYFAGHGFELQDKYMLPVDAPAAASYLREHSICETKIIRNVLRREPLVFVLLLDMCLKCPTEEENQGIYDEKPKIYRFEPQRNLIRGYATTSHLGSYERDNESNGIYMKHLKKFMLQENYSIDAVLEEVGKSVSRDAPDVVKRQMPSMQLNTVEKFYFSDAVKGNKNTSAYFDELNLVPDAIRIEFHILKIVAKVTFSRLACFQNALVITSSDLEDWKVDVDKGNLELDINRSVVESVNSIVIIIHNLQKIQSPLLLTISLKDKNTNILVDNAILEIGMPLICPELLWYDKSAAQRMPAKATETNHLL